MKSLDYDVGIVGGGFSGLYAAHRILKKHPHYKIAIFEKSSRLGGRIFTAKHGNHTLEYGPMRFELDLQPRLAALLEELQIQTRPFSGYSAPFDIEPNYNKLNIDEIAAIINNKGKLPPSFALFKHAFCKILGDQWDLETDNVNDKDRILKKQWIRNNGMFQGRLLHNHGLWDTLAHVLSKSAIDFIRENGSFYHMIHSNPNAANQMLFIMDMLATQEKGLVTIDGGSSQLISTLANGTRDKVKMFSGAEVTDVNDNGFVVKAQQEILCDHMLFTCPKNALERIRGFPADVYPLLDSVLVVDLYKIFIIIENPPWTKETVPRPNTNVGLLPCREVHYGYDAETQTGMVMLYGDDPTLRYWSAFCLHGKIEVPEEMNNNHMLNHLYHYLHMLYPNEKHKMRIKTYTIMDWSRKPFESGVHIWRPGYKSDDIINKLKCFGEKQNMHICGETYSNYQGFIEGCILSVDNVVSAL